MNVTSKYKVTISETTDWEYLVDWENEKKKTHLYDLGQSWVKLSALLFSHS